MGVVFADGFDVNLGIASLTAQWGANMATPGIIFGTPGYLSGTNATLGKGKCLRFEGIAGPNRIETIQNEIVPVSGDDIIVTMRINCNRPVGILFICRSPSGGEQFRIELIPDNFQFLTGQYQLGFFRGSELLHRTRTLSSATWHQLEFRVNVHPSVGVLDVRINKFTEVQLANVNTADDAEAGWAAVGLGGQGFAVAEAYVQIDDFVVADNNPVVFGDHANSLLGDVVCESVFPVVDSVSTFGTTASSGGADFADVDDPDVDGDTTYVNNPPSASVTMFKMDTLSRVTSGILAVHISSDVRKVTGNGIYAHAVLKKIEGAPEQPLFGIGQMRTISSVTYDREYALETASYFDVSKLWNIDDFPDLEWGWITSLSAGNNLRTTRFYIEVVGFAAPEVQPAAEPARLPGAIRPVWRDGVRVTTVWQTHTRREQESGSEERKALQSRPARLVEAVVTGVHQDMSLHALIAHSRALKDSQPYPLYSDHAKLLTATTGVEQELVCDTTFRRFFRGARVMVIDQGVPSDTALRSATFVIDQVFTDRILLEDAAAVVGTWSVGARIFPAIDSEVSLELSSALQSDQHIEISASIEEKRGAMTLPPSWRGPIDSLFPVMRQRNYPASSAVESDAPLVSLTPDWGSGAAVDIVRMGERFTVGKATVSQLEASRPAYGFGVDVKAFTRKAAFDIIRLFDWARGSARPWWLVNPQTTWKIVGVDTTNNAYIDITEPPGGDILDIIDLFDYVGIETITNLFFAWDITNVTDEGGGVWRIHINPELVTAGNWRYILPTVANIRSVMPVHNVRFTSDSLTEEWATNEICEFRFHLTEVLDEVPDNLIVNDIPGATLDTIALIPDLHYWGDPNRNCYQDFTKLFGELFNFRVEEGHIESDGWPSKYTLAERVYDARLNLPRRIPQKAEDRFGGHLINRNQNFVPGGDPPFVVRSNVPWMLNGMRVWVNPEWWWSPASATNPVVTPEEQSFWDNTLATGPDTNYGTGLTIIIIYVNHVSPFGVSNPQRFMTVQNFTLDSVLEWDLAGVDDGGNEKGEVRLYDPPGTLVSTCLHEPMGYYDPNDAQQDARIASHVLRWANTGNTSTVRQGVISNLGATSFAEVPWTSPFSQQIPHIAQAAVTWFNVFHTTDWGHPTRGAGTTIPAREIPSTMYGQEAIPLAFLLFKRALTNTEVNTVLNYYKSLYGQPVRFTTLPA